MHISDVYLGLGEDVFAQLIRGISIGKLKTYQIYEGFKVRAHLQKVNTETLRKAVPRLWDRISGRDEEFARDLAQAILVSHLDMIAGAVLGVISLRPLRHLRKPQIVHINGVQQVETETDKQPELIDT